MKFPASCLLIVAFVGAGGCKRHAASTAPPTASTHATSDPVVRRATLDVDGEPTTFDAAEITVRPAGSGITVDLSTGAGENTLHFDMGFEDLADASELNGAEWPYEAPQELLEDSLDGIHLRHGAVLLDPVKVRAGVQWKDEKHAVIDLAGSFRWFEPPEAETPNRTVDVSGRIEATLRE